MERFRPLISNRQFLDHILNPPPLHLMKFFLVDRSLSVIARQRLLRVPSPDRILLQRNSLSLLREHQPGPLWSGTFFRFRSSCFQHRGGSSGPEAGPMFSTYCTFLLLRLQFPPHSGSPIAPGKRQSRATLIHSRSPPTSLLFLPSASPPLYVLADDVAFGDVARCRPL